MKKYLLCIDQGTTGTKVLLMNDQGEIHSSSYQKHTQYYQTSGWVEHDAEEIWTCICQGINEALQKGKVHTDQVQSIGLANQGETVMFWHPSSGRPLYRSIVWSCRRSQGIARRWEQDGDWKRKIADKTGLRIDPYFSATKIRWMMEEVPQVHDHIDRDEVRCSTLDTWIIWKMTGGAAYVTDPSTAVRTLLYNIRTCEWDREILDYLQIKREWLPTVQPSMGLLGYTDPALFCGIHAPIHVSLVDQPAALFGNLCTETGMSKCTYGTGCFVHMNLGSESLEAPSDGLYSTIVWDIDGKATYALDGAVYSAGSAINWGIESLRLYDSIAQLQMWSEAWVGEEPLSDAKLTDELKNQVWFVPSLSGIGAPYWNSNQRGGFIGLSYSTTPAGMARAILEGIAQRVADVLEAMHNVSDHPITVLKADGGLTRNPYLMQTQADLLGIPVEVADDPDTTAKGVGYMTGIACDWWDLERLNQKEVVKNVYHPRISQESRQQMRTEWKKLIRLMDNFYQ